MWQVLFRRPGDGDPSRKQEGLRKHKPSHAVADQTYFVADSRFGQRRNVFDACPPIRGTRGGDSFGIVLHGRLAILLPFGPISGLALPDSYSPVRIPNIPATRQRVHTGISIPIEAGMCAPGGGSGQIKSREVKRGRFEDRAHVAPGVSASSWTAARVTPATFRAARETGGQCCRDHPSHGRPTPPSCYYIAGECTGNHRREWVDLLGDKTPD